jgi:hypothetical protein
MLSHILRSTRIKLLQGIVEACQFCSLLTLSLELLPSANGADLNACFFVTGAYTHSNRLELSTKVATLPPILLNLVRRLVASGQLPWPSPPCLPQSQAKVSTSKDDVSRASPGASSSVDSKPDVDKAAESSSSNSSASADSDAPAAEDSFEGVSSWCCTVNCYSPGQWIPPHIDNPKVLFTLNTCNLRFLFITW